MKKNGHSSGNGRQAQERPMKKVASASAGLPLRDRGDSPPARSSLRRQSHLGHRRPPSDLLLFGDRRASARLARLLNSKENSQESPQLVNLGNQSRVIHGPPPGCLIGGLFWAKGHDIVVMVAHGEAIFVPENVQVRTVPRFRKTGVGSHLRFQIFGIFGLKGWKH